MNVLPCCLALQSAITLCAVYSSKLRATSDLFLSPPWPPEWSTLPLHSRAVTGCAGKKCLSSYFSGSVQGHVRAAAVVASDGEGQERNSYSAISVRPDCCTVHVVPHAYGSSSGDVFVCLCIALPSSHIGTWHEWSLWLAAQYSCWENDDKLLWQSDVCDQIVDQSVQRYLVEQSFDDFLRIINSQ